MIKRIGAVVIVDSGLVVNAYNFSKHLPVGRLKFTVKRLQELKVDEIIILNSSHSNSPVTDFRDLYADFSSWHVATPIAYGGGIVSKSQARSIIKDGADRIVVSAAVLISGLELLEIGEILGEQAIILHLPIVSSGDDLKVLNFENIPLDSLLAMIPKNWGGEVLLSIVENDGAKFSNLEVIQECLEKLGETTRVILSGGFNRTEDILMGLKARAVQAVAIGNFLHRTEVSIPFLKESICDEVQTR
jgi:imidazole glycerol phosphate synthase subunit HisF